MLHAVFVAGVYIVKIIEIYLVLEAQMEEMESTHEKLPAIHKKSQRLFDQLEELHTASLDQSGSLGSQRRSTFKRYMKDSFESMQQLHDKMQFLDQHIKNKGTNFHERLFDYAVKKLWVDTEKELVEECFEKIQDVHGNIEYLFQTIMIRRGTESKSIHSSWGYSGPIHSHSNRQIGSFDLQHRSRNVTRITGALDDHDFLREIQQHSSYIWDNEARAVEIHTETGRMLPLGTTRVVLLNSKWPGAGISIALWDAEMNFYHFQVQGRLPFSSIPVPRTSRANRVMVIRHQLSGITWDESREPHKELEVVISFERGRDARKLRGHAQGYKIRRASRIIAQNGRGEALLGIAEVIDIASNGDWNQDFTRMDRSVRVLELWLFQRHSQTEIYDRKLHIISPHTSYSIDPKRRRILIAEEAVVLRGDGDLAALVFHQTAMNFSDETVRLKVEFIKTRDAERTLRLIERYQKTCFQDSWDSDSSFLTDS